MKLLKHQFWHLLCLGALLWAVYVLAGMDPTILKGEFLGFDTLFWLLLALGSPVLHQVYVLVCWRFELLHKSISRAFGKDGFRLFKIGFAILILSRPVTIVLLAISNAFTFTMNSILSYGLSILLLLPGLYLMYSVRKYFGFDRAFGIDHFYPGKYRDVPMVKQGIFRFSSNAMYVFGFFLLWVPGILGQSKAVLLVAAFNHLYIWVHYYFTEQPDMEIIYGGKDNNKI
ncbi:MAG: phosphatidylethanolamine N-methyltransferase family protein [Eudoraea sp.]|nr:phosphatidylethanolamine N-methyltransferase family protein [Eudoraea sp.]